MVELQLNKEMDDVVIRRRRVKDEGERMRIGAGIIVAMQASSLTESLATPVSRLASIPASSF